MVGGLITHALGPIRHGGLKRTRCLSSRKFQRGEVLRKSGNHIQNSVGMVGGIGSMLYLIENTSFICIAKIRILESNLLTLSSGSLVGTRQEVLAFR